jgi:hypothetical protein
MPHQPLDEQKPQTLRMSSRITAGVLGSLSALMLLAVLYFERGGMLFAVVSCAVCAAVFLHAAWSGSSPVFLDHPEVLWRWVEKKLRRR